MIDLKSRVLRTLMRYLRAYGAIKMLFKHFNQVSV